MNYLTLCFFHSVNISKEINIQLLFLLHVTKNAILNSQEKIFSEIGKEKGSINESTTEVSCILLKVSKSQSQHNINFTIVVRKHYVLNGKNKQILIKKLDMHAI